MTLGVAQLTPLFGAVMICWIFSVCVHEFSHALVAYWGGDHTVRERGYLRFNIFAFIDPVTSLLLPALFLFMGGIPLPGGAVRINTHLLRSKYWDSLVSAAGPVSNFILFLLIAAVIHPSSGIVDPGAPVQPMWVALLGTMAVLELFAVFFNLIPIPPLDGFGIIRPYLSEELQRKAAAIGWIGLFALFFVFFRIDAVMAGFMDLISVVLEWFGLPFEVTWRQYNFALFGRSQ